MPEIFSSYLHNAKNAFPIQALRNIVYSILPEQDRAGQDISGEDRTEQGRASISKNTGRQKLVTICGKSGSGKTMLLNAIANHLGQDREILFARADNWLAGQNNREKDQLTDQAGLKDQIILLDDLQDIAGLTEQNRLSSSGIGGQLPQDSGPKAKRQGKGTKKVGWQEDLQTPAASQLCAVLDSLALTWESNGGKAGKPAENDGTKAKPGIPELVILAFCGPAASLASLGQRLQTRLCQGLVLELHAPDLDVRLKYAESFAKKQKITLERSQLVHIARYCGNIPAVAGVMTRIRAWLEAGFSLPDQTGLEKLVQNGGQAVMPGCRDIVHEVARLTDTRPAEIIGRSRKAEVVLARQLAIIVCRRLLGLSYMELGREFGGRDHSTVMHAIEKFHKAATSDKRMNNLVTEVESNLNLRTENLASRLSMFVA